MSVLREVLKKSKTILKPSRAGHGSEGKHTEIFVDYHRVGQLRVRHAGLDTDSAIAIQVPGSSR